MIRFLKSVLIILVLLVFIGNAIVWSRIFLIVGDPASYMGIAMHVLIGTFLGSSLLGVFVLFLVSVAEVIGSAVKWALK